jgi:hypothetical protein
MLVNFFYTSILILLISTGCNQNPSPSPYLNWQSIAGRNDEQSTTCPLLYRAHVPFHWRRKDPPIGESIADTTQSICEFYIQEDDQTIRITIHTFPIMPNAKRIPSQAHVMRWKRQFEELDVLATHVLPESHGGFSGLYFEGQGLLQKQTVKVIAWSMQLASLYEQQLNLEKHSLDRYKRADYTIKASGPPPLMDQHRAAILAFARSFELIDELPSPL